MLERLPEGQSWLFEIMQKLGYPGDDRGVCFGISHMAMQAILADEVSEFDKRLSIIATLINFSPEELEDYFEKYRAIRKKKYQSPHKENNEINENELLTEEIPAFFEGIEIYHNQNHYPFLFARKKLPTHPDAILTLPLVISNKLKDQEIFVSSSFSGPYDEQRLEQLFNLLLQKLAASNERAAIVMESSNHAITVGYDPKTKEWLFINPNQLPTKRLPAGELRAIAKLVISAFSDSDTVVLSSKIYGLSNPQLENKSILSDVTQTQEWQTLHSVSEDKIHLVDSDNASWLYIAAQYGDLQKVEELIAANSSNVNLIKNDTGMSPLYIAAQNGHLAIVEKLIASAADVNLAERDTGMSPLYVAAQNGHLEIVEKLIAADAKVDLTDIDKATPISIAAENGHLDIVKLLITAKTDVNLADIRGATPLYIAAQNGHLEIVKRLINAGADINFVDKDGVTALFIAATNGDVEMVNYLIASGANVNLARSDGVTALYLAAQNGDLEILKQLIPAGANINSVDDEGLTPLMVAVQNGHSEIVHELIVDANINIDFADADGITALFLAVRSGNEEIVEMLIQAQANAKILVKADIESIRGFAKETQVTDAMEQLIKEKDDGSKEIFITAEDIAKVMGNENIISLLQKYTFSLGPNV